MQNDRGRVLDLPCRYYRVYTDADVPCIESNFEYVERRLPVPVAQAALVLVDVWSTHYVDSWIARAGEVTREKIVPLREAARQAGMRVIHAPSPFVARRYREPPATPAAGTQGANWPPAGFRGIYRAGEFAAFGRNQEPRLRAAHERYETELDISSLVRPLPDEPVIFTGDELHELLAARRILHLFYAGFATNWCLIGRDYGMIAMNQRGYNLILLRDATAGLEFHDTAASQMATEMTIREIETKQAWSATTDAFVVACREAK